MTLAESICQFIKQREEFGAKKYGRPLCPHSDRRDFLREAFEEWADQGFYLMAAIEKRQRSLGKQRVRQARYDQTDKGKARQARYDRSSKGRARSRRTDASAKGRVRHARYNAKPAAKELQKWQKRSWRKLQRIQNATL